MAVVGLLLYVPAIWAEWFDTEAVGKTMAIVGLFSFSFAQCCLLSLATLQRQVAWLFYAAVTAILLLAAIISGIIVFDPHDEEWLMRTVGVVAILDGCFSLCVPILHRLGSRQTVRQTAIAYQQIELVCPRCGKRGTYSVGEIVCRKCSLTIRVQVRGLTPARSAIAGCCFGAIAFFCLEHFSAVCFSVRLPSNGLFLSAQAGTMTIGSIRPKPRLAFPKKPGFCARQIHGQAAVDLALVAA